MKNYITYALILAISSCSGGGSSSSSGASESLVNESFVLQASTSEALVLFKEGGDAWRDRSANYSLLITESSIWDRGLQAGGERFYGEGDELVINYEPTWSSKTKWGQEHGFEDFETDSFTYEIWSPGADEPVVGPVKVTLEIRPTLYVSDGGVDGTDNPGNDTNPGTREEPLATITRALEIARPGAVINVCSWYEIDEWGGESFPLILQDNVVLKSSAGTPIMGHGEYFSQSMQDSVNASVVLEGTGSMVQGFYIGDNALVLDPIAPAVGVLVEGRDHVISSCGVTRFNRGIMCRSVSNVSIVGADIRGCVVGIDAGQTLGRSTVRNSLIMDCIEVGVYLSRPNDLDLGTEDARGGNEIYFNGLGIGWPLDAIGGVQDAYGNVWNEFPLSTMELNNHNHERSYDAIEGQQLFIDSRGGSSVE